MDKETKLIMKQISIVSKGLVILLASVLLAGVEATSSFAQVIPLVEIPSSINPVGSGARALGMGGAFIAVADDATAASWNPGGLIQLETPEVSIVGAYFQRDEDNTFGERPDASGLEDVSKGSVNYLSATYPFNALNRNMVISINYQNLYDFTRHWKFPLVSESGDLSLSQKVKIEQEGNLAAIGFAYCVQVTPRLSFGLTLNIWEDGLYDNGWEQNTKQSGSGTFLGLPFSYTRHNTEEYSFSGLNANLGMLWNLTNNITIGAVLKTPFTADLEHRSTSDLTTTTNSSSTPPSDKDEKLDMPMSYGIGFSYRFSDRFTAVIDIYRTEWDDYLLTDADGNETSPINNKSKDEADIDPTNQLRVGCEYLHIADSYVVPIRGGFFYDPAPAEGSPDEYYGISLGSGYARGKVVFDIAYQFRWGNDVGSHLYEGLDFSQDMREHTLYTSIIYHF